MRREAHESSGQACLGRAGLECPELGHAGLEHTGQGHAGRGRAVQLKQERPCLSKEEGQKESTAVTCPLSFTYANFFIE